MSTCEKCGLPMADHYGKSLRFNSAIGGLSIRFCPSVPTVPAVLVTEHSAYTARMTGVRVPEEPE